MSMEILPDFSQAPKQAPKQGGQPAAPKATKAPKPPKSPRGPRQVPEVKREHLLVAVAVVLAVGAGFVLWPRSSHTPSTPPVVSVPVASGTGGGATTTTASDGVAVTTTKAGPVRPSNAVGHLPAGSARAFAHRVTAAIRHQSGVHIALAAVEPGGVAFTASGDVGVHTGFQTISVRGMSLSARLVDGVVYVQGDDPLFENLSGFSKKIADLTGGRWVALSPGDKPYRKAVQGMTLGNFYPATLGLVGRLRLSGPKVQDGVASVGVTGSDYGDHSASETVWVQEHGAPLPVRDRAVGDHMSEDTTFTQWGEKIAIAVPVGAVSYRSLAVEAAHED